MMQTPTKRETRTPRTDAINEATEIAGQYGFEPFDPADHTSWGTKSHRGLCSKRSCRREAFFQKELGSGMHAYCWKHMTDSVFNADRYPDRRVEGAYDRLLELWDQYENGVVA